MVSRSALSERFTLFPPASRSAIEREEDEYGGSLPREYVALLRMSDGLHSDGNLSILGAEGVVRRNNDYEVQTYLPDFFMIGDDGGGNAILLNLSDRRIYEVGMGVMDEESLELSAGSLDELLALGTCLAERGGG
ncbi:SMI1/KNR4 family protein [Ruania halotolerans]|uniref:SMI1/KNR4 family protein n=1 Tax=Ruania halotolerans TaxID=2897773 RepID=UPI001E4D821B|nr:SMI1/KNR4 family protein [Ruania halotolerans]UFU07465.1 SMI1/KNR4 family protein [Ruania halotolerans]